MLAGDLLAASEGVQHSHLRSIPPLPNRSTLHHGLPPHCSETHRGLGILNVWFLRSGKATSYRGRNAKTLREEFAVYGLPFPVFCFIGFLKVGCALALLTSIWIPGLAQPAALGMGTLMLGAFVMHLKVKDPLSKALPSLVVLAMCLAITFL